MKLHHVALTIKDLEISLPFYESNFGFKEIKRFRRDDMGATGCMIENENIILELWQYDNFKEGKKEDMSFSGFHHIAFTEDDVETLYNNFIEKGIICGPLRKGASGGTYFFMQDPDGNEIEIYKPNN